MAESGPTCRAAAAVPWITLASPVVGITSHHIAVIAEMLWLGRVRPALPCLPIRAQSSAVAWGTAWLPKRALTIPPPTATRTSMKVPRASENRRLPSYLSSQKSNCLAIEFGCPIARKATSAWWVTCSTESPSRGTEISWPGGHCGNSRHYGPPDRACHSRGGRPARLPARFPRPSWSACPAARPHRSAQTAGAGPLGKLVQQLLIGRRQLHGILALADRHVSHWCLLRLGSYTIEITVPSAPHCLSMSALLGGCALVEGLPQDGSDGVLWLPVKGVG